MGFNSAFKELITFLGLLCWVLLTFQCCSRRTVRNFNSNAAGLGAPYRCLRV